MSALPTDDTDPDASLELVEVLKPLRQVHGVATTYERIWGAAFNGAFTARRVGRRWHVRRGDLPLIAAVLSGPASPARAEPAERVPAAA